MDRAGGAVNSALFPSHHDVRETTNLRPIHSQLSWWKYCRLQTVFFIIAMIRQAATKIKQAWKKQIWISQKLQYKKSQHLEVCRYLQLMHRSDKYFLKPFINKFSATIYTDNAASGHPGKSVSYKNSFLLMLRAGEKWSIKKKSSLYWEIKLSGNVWDFLLLQSLNGICS